MIYRKDANFPYPILTGTSQNYQNNEFLIDIEINEDTENYYFQLNNVEIESEFINNLLRNNEARLILIIQSKDNKFYFLKSQYEQITIPKSRISLNRRTSIQLHIQAEKDISFSNNDDLNRFYDVYKENIIVPKNALLGFSNVLVLEGRFKKPLELFSKTVDPDLKSEIKIELGSETINICYKEPNFQLNDVRNSNAFNYPYVYMGLQKALQRFINTYGEDDAVDIEFMEVPEDLLDQKLYNLMQNKSITELNSESIDEVIHLISDNLVEKYTVAVKEMSNSGD